MGSIDVLMFNVSMKTAVISEFTVISYSDYSKHQQRLLMLVLLVLLLLPYSKY